MTTCRYCCEPQISDDHQCAPTPTPTAKRLMVHELKCWPEPFAAAVNREKRHEVRVFDRDFQEGDGVLLREWEPERQQYTGRTYRCEVGYVTQPGTWGLPAGVGCFTIL